ncbi:MAG: TonB-dependent receptor plug domain-containing protein [Opitutaceae bacterium]
MKTPCLPQTRLRSFAVLFTLGAAVAPSLLAQSTPSAATPAPGTSDSAAQDPDLVVLSPFVISTKDDRGYAATNVISGSRVSIAIKDLPLPMQVITSEFINDIGATDLRKSLSYSAGISLKTQNDMENTGGVGGIQMSPYGPGGVNNPEGVTANISQTQVKIRGFLTNNVLRDGFLRGSPSDSINIDRVEVVQGPNALLYGTGNFGGVVDYLTKKPLDIFQGWATFSIGSYGSLRSTIDVTGPLSAKLPGVDYRMIAAAERAESNVDYQKSEHTFLAPSFSWAPTKTTKIVVETELGHSQQRGFGFRALRAAQGTGATPINNDQLEATGFYYPPGADKRTMNLSGPDTYNNQRQENLQIVATQQILAEGDWTPGVDALAGYSYSNYWQATRDVNGGIQQILPGNPGAEFGQTITIASVGNGLGDGVTPSNLNLQYGTFDNEVVRYAWAQGRNLFERQQERVELTARKTLFHRDWYRFDDQVLVGYSELFNQSTTNHWQTLPGLYFYKKPLELTPIRFGVNGDGSAGPAMYQDDLDNINKGWDRAFYLNNFLKFGRLWGVDDRIIIMAGLRRDVSAKWSTDTQISATGVRTITTSRADDTKHTSKQTGIMVKLTRDLSVFALKADGFQPNFGGLHDALTGKPVGADTAQSKEFGIKFDFFNGKISGSISTYKIRKQAWAASGFSTPAPLGNPRFDPTKKIIYNLGDANGTGFYNPFASTTYTTRDASGNQITVNGFVANGQTYTPNAAEQAAWIAACNAGAVTLVSPLNGQSADRGSIYLDASNPAGAAWLDAMFAAAAPGWAGWLYHGNDINDPGINNATLDDAAFQNGPLNAAWQVESEAKGWDGQVFFTPNDQLQIVLSASFNSSVRLINKGTWLKYPYPEDRWATWYFPNGGFGLKGQTLAAAYTDPTDTSTRTNTGYFPGDDTPKYRYTLFANYKFAGALKGLIVGLGGDYSARRAYFSGITHGSGQAQTDTDGKLIVLYMPSQVSVNGFVRKEWKAGNHEQYCQLNVDNLLNDTKLYGQIYNPPISFRLTYGIAF